jgi:hypothetical protein
LEKGAGQVLPGSEGSEGEREGMGGEGRNDSNNVCTYEYMNKEKKNVLYNSLFHGPSENTT